MDSTYTEKPRSLVKRETGGTQKKKKRAKEDLCFQILKLEHLLVLSNDSSLAYSDCHRSLFPPSVDYSLLLKSFSGENSFWI